VLRISIIFVFFVFLHASFDKQWKIILHLNHSFDKLNSKFYLSYPDINATKELNLDIKQIKSLNKEFICKFPYRYKFLRQYYKLPYFDLNRCNNLQKFLKKFKNNNQLGVIFTSALRDYPQSSFGHIMLIFINKNNLLNSNIVHFYAKTRQEKFIKYAYDGLVGNFDATFEQDTLSNKIKFYNNLQQRTMFLYYLNYSDKQVKNLLLHLYELKSFKAKYYFLDYNCASGLLDLLKTIDSNIDDSYILISLPIDTLKTLKSHINNIKILLPLNQQVILLLQKMDYQQQRLFLLNVENKYKKDINKLPDIVKEALQKYYIYKYSRASVYRQYSKFKKVKYKKTPLDTSSIIDPLHAIQPTEIQTYYSSDGLIFDVRPFNIDKFDYQNNLVNEFTYKLFDFQFLYHQKLQLEKLDIAYSESLNKIYYPYFIPISWRIYLGLNKENIEHKLAFDYELGIGQTFQKYLIFNYFVSIGVNAGAYKSVFIKPEINLMYYLKDIKLYDNYFIKSNGYYKNIIGSSIKIDDYKGFLIQYIKDNNIKQFRVGFYISF